VPREALGNEHPRVADAKGEAEGTAGQRTRKSPSSAHLIRLMVDAAQPPTIERRIYQAVTSTTRPVRMD
jgi:hypothetical protein